MPYHGILNLNKPAHTTSRRVVDRVARLAKPAKVGHAGTLDPLATGVLLVAVGSATRLIEYLQCFPKRYRAVVRLGARSATDDVESTLEPLRDAPVPSRRQVQAALKPIVGRVRQRPPAYSAVHVRGRRAYELARRGESVAPEPRWVEIHELALLSYTPQSIAHFHDDTPPLDLPRLELDVLCGSGTYIRALARDLGESLGGGGVLEALTRTRIGPFELDDALDPLKLNADTWLDHLHPLLDAVPDLPCYNLPPLLLHRLTLGQSVPLEAAHPLPHSSSAAQRRRSPSASAELALVDAQGQLVAIALVDDKTGHIRPHRVLAQA